MELPLHHPILQWMAWWATGIFNRFAVRHHGRTAHEYSTGHKTKLPDAYFGETVLWRKKRTSAELNKHDVEYSEGIFLGISGLSTELVVGTAKGVFRTRDVRALSEPEAKWNGKAVLDFDTSFEQYIDPTETLPDRIAIEPGVVAHDDLPPEPEVTVTRRRMRLAPEDFSRHGYTAGCPGCIALRRKAPSKNHSESCRKRMEECLGETAEGRNRKEKEASRKEQELTEALEAEDAANQKEAEVQEQARREAESKVHESVGESMDDDEPFEDGPAHASDESRRTRVEHEGPPSMEVEPASSSGSRDAMVGVETFATDRAPRRARQSEQFDIATPPTRGTRRARPVADVAMEQDGTQLPHPADASIGSPIESPEAT